MINIKDWVLVIWLISSFLWDMFCIGGSIYLVVWKHCSGLWIVLAMLLSYQPTLFEVLRKRYAIEKEEAE